MQKVFKKVSEAVVNIGYLFLRRREANTERRGKGKQSAREKGLGLGVLWLEKVPGYKWGFPRVAAKAQLHATIVFTAAL